MMFMCSGSSEDDAAKEAARQEAARQEAARREVARQEEEAWLDANPLEKARREAAKQEEARQEEARREEARRDAARLEMARQKEAKQEEARRAKARRKEARQEAARQEEARQEETRHEEARREEARLDAARQKAAVALIRRLQPPVSNEGAWVRREDFRGRKSFGAFKCPQCRNMWTSAHAQVEYKQGCKACNCESLPVAMWVNSERHTHGDYVRDNNGENKPHDGRRVKRGAPATVNPTANS
eukprot:gene3662-13737_t